MNYVVDVVGSLEAIPREQWESVSRGAGFYSSYPWMQASAQNPGATSHFLCVRDGIALLAVLPVFISNCAGGSYDPTELLGPTIGAEPLSRQLWSPTLLAGNRSGYCTELLVLPDLNRTERAGVMRTLMAALCDFGKDRGARSIVLLYLTNEACKEIIHVNPGARPFLISADTCIDVRFPDFDAYLLSLPQHRRRNTRRDFRKFEVAGYQVQEGRLREWYSRAAPLLCNLQRRYGHAATVEGMTSYLRNQADALDEHGVVFLLLAGDTLVGFCLCYRWHESLYVRVSGFEYSQLRDSNEYFSLVLYHPIRHAIESGLRTVWCGLDSYEAKILRGARLVPRWAVALQSCDPAFPAVGSQWRERNRNTLDAWRPWLRMAEQEAEAVDWLEQWS